MTFREPDREIILDATPVAPTTLIQDEAVENPPLIEEEGPEAVPAGALAALPSPGEDPLRLYLKGIGKVSLLSARQEVEIGRRIEGGQIPPRPAPAGNPPARRAQPPPADRAVQRGGGWQGPGGRGGGAGATPARAGRGAVAPAAAGAAGRDRAERSRGAPGQEGPHGGQPPAGGLRGQALSG